MLANMLIQQNPQLQQTWQQAQQMAKGKSPEEGQAMIKNIAKQQNINLDEMWGNMVKQFGLNNVNKPF